MNICRYFNNAVIVSKCDLFPPLGNLTTSLKCICIPDCDVIIQLGFKTTSGNDYVKEYIIDYFATSISGNSIRAWWWQTVRILNASSSTGFKYHSGIIF